MSSGIPPMISVYQKYREKTALDGELIWPSANHDNLSKLNSAKNEAPYAVNRARGFIRLPAK